MSVLDITISIVQMRNSIGFSYYVEVLACYWSFVITLHIILTERHSPKDREVILQNGLPKIQGGAKISSGPTFKVSPLIYR